MGIKINDASMHAEISGATAEQTEKGWTVSWLPQGTTVGRNQAVTAMVLSEAIAANPEDGADEWLFIDGWAEELGLDRSQALELFAARYVHSGLCIYCPHGPACATCTPGSVNGPVCISCAAGNPARRNCCRPYFSGDYLAVFGDDE